MHTYIAGLGERELRSVPPHCEEALMYSRDMMCSNGHCIGPMPSLMDRNCTTPTANDTQYAAMRRRTIGRQSSRLICTVISNDAR